MRTTTKPIDFTKQTTILTGASSGIGAAFARELASRGSTLILVARRRERLEALADSLSREHNVRVVVAALDLASPTAATDLRAEILASGLHPTSLVNNAGFGTYGPFLQEDPDALEREIRLDVATPVRLCAEFLPDLVEAERGYLINVASMAAYNPVPRMAVYAAAKSFVLNFTEAIAVELRDTGVTVFALSPGATNTEFNSVVGTEDATAGARMRSAQDVVDTAVRHLGRRDPAPSVIDGWTNRVGAALNRIIPRRWALNVMDRLTSP